MRVEQCVLNIIRHHYVLRRENNWESPKTAVAREMARLGFTDCWAAVGRPGLVGTCRSVVIIIIIIIIHHHS